MATDKQQAARTARNALPRTMRERWSAPGPNGTMWYHHPRLGHTYDGHKPSGYIIPYDDHAFGASYVFVEHASGISAHNNQHRDHETAMLAMSWIMELADVHATAERKAA